MTTIEAVHQAAREAYAAGLCIVPTAEDGSKQPKPHADDFKWVEYQTRRSTPEELKCWYPGRTGLGVICGTVSGHVGNFDFDDRPTYDALVELARQADLGDLVSRIEAGYCDDTPTGGVRWLVRYPADFAWPFEKLAKRPKRPEELTGTGDKTKGLIESTLHTILAPTKGRVHPSGKPYVRRSGGFPTIATLTADECEAVLSLARSFDEMPVVEASPASEPKTMSGNRPGDDFIRRTTWAEVLEPAGWRAVYTRGDVTHWRRPGKTRGTSATTNFGGSDYLIVFSSSTPFETGRGYNRFSAYVLLNHGGNVSDAARELGAKGYGERPQAPGGTRSGADTSGQAHAESGTSASTGLPEVALADAVDVAAEGRRIEQDGIPYTVDGLIVALGMLAFLVAFAKVGKTTFGQALAAAVAMGRRFLDRGTTRTRVLVIAAEDPPEYVAWLARHLDVERGSLTFYRGPVLLSADGLARICHTVKAGGYGLVLIASWQAVIRGLVKDENDNAGAVCIVEAVKAAARTTGVPWLIDAHSGKGEDQADDADPSRAMRGASAAAGAADYTLSLRYSNGAFGTQRKLSGRGRFINLEPMTIDFDAATSTYTLVADGGKDAATETTWRLICDLGALTTTGQSAGAIAKTIGLVGKDGEPTTTHKRQVAKALTNREGVLRSEEARRGGKTWLYRVAVEVVM